MTIRVLRENGAAVIKKSVIIFFLMFLMVIPLSKSSPPSNPTPQIDSETQITIEQGSRSFPVGEEVKILRAEKKKKMPYLDRRYVKETINKKTVEKKGNFTEKGPKTLKAVIERAMEVSTPVKASRERIALARRKIMVAFRELLPSFDFNFDLRKGSLSGDAFTGSNYHAIFKLPVFRGGILWNTFRREKARYQSAKKEYDAVVNELVNEVSNAFFEYNRAQLVFGDKGKLSEGAKKQYEVSRQKYEQSLISEIEYLNVESMSGQLQYEVESAEQELELAKLELQRFLNLEVSDEINVEPVYNIDELIRKADPKSEEKGEKEVVLKQSLAEFVDLAYQNRPELQVEAADLKVSQLEEQISRGSFLPRADVTFDFGELGEAFTRISDSPNHRPEWHLAFELSQNLLGNKVKYTFDRDENAPSVSQFLQGTGSTVVSRKMEIGALNGLQDYVELKDAQVKKLEQIIELEKKEREVIREVKEAFFDYQKAHIQVLSSLKRNQYRHRLVELSKLRLEKAEIEISEYLQAELDLAEERKKLHGALSDLYKAKSKLNRSIGIRDYLPMEEKYGI